MLKKSLLFCALMVGVIGATIVIENSPVLAQESHPLAGMWHGKWITMVPVANAGENFSVEMKWDSKAVTGMFNPGRFGAPMKVITLNAVDRTVHIEVDIREGHVVADGKLDNLDSEHRTIAGTWTQGVETGEFRLTRD